MADANPNVTAFPARCSKERFGPAETLRNIHFHVAISGTTIEQLLTPAYWQRVAVDVRPLDRIEITTDDGAYFAELIVLDASPTDGLRLAPLRGIELHGQVGPTGSIPRNTAGLHVQYRGPHLRWCVIRQDGELLKDRFETERAAHQWLANHCKNKAAP